MTCTFGLGYFRLSFFVLVGSIVSYAVFASVLVHAGMSWLALHPVVFAGSVVAAGAPHPTNWMLDITALACFREHLRLSAILLAFAASIPVSLWAMSAAQRPIPIAPKQKPQKPVYALALRHILQQRFYRVLLLFHFGFTMVAAPRLWIGMLCDLSATLGHFAALKFAADKFLQKPFKPDVLNSSIFVLVVMLGITSMTLIDKRVSAAAAECRYFEGDESFGDLSDASAKLCDKKVAAEEV